MNTIHPESPGHPSHPLHPPFHSGMLAAMEPRVAHNEIADWVRQVFGAGFHLDSEHLATMEASFGIADPADLSADPLSSDAASFLDLLFFPDRSVRETFETRWGDQTFPAGAVRAVLDALAHPSPVTILYIEGRNPSVALTVDEDAVAGFVQRMNIDWRPPGTLREVLESRLAAPPRIRVRAALRQTRLGWHENQVAMLDLFLSRFGVAQDDFEACLTFLLSILDPLAPGDDLFGFLIAQKHFYFQSLCRAEEFERRRQSANMETLILQGERAAHGSIQEWRELMRRVDRICTALFGQTRFFQQPMARQVSLEAKDLERIVDFLG